MVVGGLRETFGFPRELNTLQLRNRVDPKEFQAAISRPLWSKAASWWTLRDLDEDPRYALPSKGLGVGKVPQPKTLKRYKPKTL